MADENKKQDPEENKNPEQDNQKDKKLSALIVSYKKSYPQEKTFHVTSDYQVFLKKDLDSAKRHQKSVDKEKEIQTIKV